MPTKKKLGLNDIFPVAEANTVTDAALARAFPQIEEQALQIVGDIGRTFGQIPIDRIVPNPFQPRRHFDHQKLQELADSLRDDGMLEPILVRVSPKQAETYEIAAGERRWRAAQLAGMTACPAEILADCPDTKMRRIALLENLQREELTPLELAETYGALMGEKDEQEKPIYTVRSLAEMLKKDKGHVDDHLALLRVPTVVRQLIEEDPDIPVRVIRELGGVEDANDRAFLIAEVRARNLKTADLIAILQQQRLHKRKQREQEAQVEAETQQQPIAQPSPALAVAVLERKLQRYHADVAKTVNRISKDLPTMSDEQRMLVRQYAMTWITELQRLLEG